MGKSDSDLLPGMEARPHKSGLVVTYRYHPSGGRPINLGTDLAEALESVRRMRNLLPPLDALSAPALRELLRRHQKGALQRRIPFALEEFEVAALLASQGNRCAVTKLAFSEAKPAGMRIRPWLPSLDRRDSRKGYRADNVRVVCAFVNVAMNGFGEAMFRQVLAPLIEQAVAERLAELGFPMGSAT